MRNQESYACVFKIVLVGIYQTLWGKKNPQFIVKLMKFVTLLQSRYNLQLKRKKNVFSFALCAVIHFIDSCSYTILHNKFSEEINY